MTLEELALKHQETADRSLRNEGRIKKLEEGHEILRKLATSVEVMAFRVENMGNSVTTLAAEMESLKEKPGKRWESLVDKIIWAVAAALIGYVIAQIGL